MKTVFLFLLAASVAMAQTAKSRADLYTEIDTTLASGGNITAAELRGVFKNTVASGYNGLTDTEVTFGTINATTFNVDALNIGELSLSAYIASLGYLSAGGAIGAATATTPAENDNDTSVATTAYVQTEIAGVSGVPTNGLILWPTASLGSLPTGFLEADGTEGTLNMTAIETGTWIQKTTGIAPTVSSAALGTDGTTLTITMSESVSGTDTAGGGFALTASGGAVTLGDITGTSSLVSTASRTIIDTETLTLAYVPGDYVDGIGLPLAAFSGTSVTNNSTETAGATLLASDAFNYTTGQELGSQANWTTVQGSVYTIDGIQIRPGGTNGAAYWDANTPGANHRVEITITATASEFRAVGPAVRMQGAGGAFYAATWGNLSQGAPVSGIRLKYIAAGGAETLLVADTTVGPVVGYKLAIEATGTGSATRLTVEIDTGGGWTAVTGMTSYDPATDLDGGYGGVYLYGSSSTSTKIDDFALYNL